MQFGQILDESQLFLDIVTVRGVPYGVKKVLSPQLEEGLAIYGIDPPEYTLKRDEPAGVGPELKDTIDAALLPDTDDEAPLPDGLPA